MKARLYLRDVSALVKVVAIENSVRRLSLVEELVLGARVESLSPKDLDHVFMADNNPPDLCSSHRYVEAMLLCAKETHALVSSCT